MPPAWRLRDRTLDLTEPLGAGIVNVTTDSMFSGARSGNPEQAVRDGLALSESGFAMIDVGAVAARSGPPVAPEAEAAALIPTVESLVARGVLVSADTFSAPVAASAVEAGAAIVNDISGGSEEIFDIVSSTGAGYVLMHIEGPPRADRSVPEYPDLVDQMKRWFNDRVELALSRGVESAQIAIDPGLDFDLTTADDLEILRRLDEFHALGLPLYISLSRKDFIGAVLAGSWEARLDPEDREWGTAAAVALAVEAGAQVHRLHDASALQAMRIAARIAPRWQAGAASDG